MSTPCEKYQARFNEFMDRELNPGDCRELEKHLEQCPQCRKELRLLRLTLEAVRQLPAPPAPQDFLIKLRQRIVLETRPQPVGSFRKATNWLMTHPVMVAAGFVLVFTGAFLLGRFAPAPAMTAKHSEMEPMKAWDQSMLSNWPTEFVPTKVSANLDTVYQRTAPSSAPSPASRPAAEWSLTMPRADSGGYAGPESAAEREKSEEIQNQVFLQTPTQLVINLLRSDPAFQAAKIYPIDKGAVAQTRDLVYRITISDQNFLNALKWMAEKKALPKTIAEAQKDFGLEIEKMPNPLKPAE